MKAEVCNTKEIGLRRRTTWICLAQLYAYVISRSYLSFIKLNVPGSEQNYQKQDLREGPVFLPLQKARVLIPSTHMLAYNYLPLQYQKIFYLLLGSVGTRNACGTQMYIQTKYL